MCDINYSEIFKVAYSDTLSYEFEKAESTALTKDKELTIPKIDFTTSLNANKLSKCTTDITDSTYEF